MGRIIGAAPVPAGVTQQVPIGGVTAVFRSGANYKAVGELVQRSVCTALSAAFPRNGAFSSAGITMPTTNNWASVAYGNGVFVAVGTASGNGATNVFAISKDGKNWSQVVVPQAALWTAVAYGAGLFCAFGNGSGTTYLLTSPDGINWTARAAPGFAPNAGCVVWNGSVFAGIQSGNGNAFSSPDGIIWTARTLPGATAWSGLAWCAGAAKFVAIASASNQSATSPDGITWTSRTLPASTFKAIAANSTTFVIPMASSSPAPAVYTSTDGINWTARATPGLGYSTNAIVWGDGVFVTSGKDSSTALVSYDGASWSEKAIPASTALWSSMAFGAGMFLGLFASPQSGNANGHVVYAENLTDSDYLYLSGTPGNFVRVA